MKFSYKDLQNYLTDPLPNPEELAIELSHKAFEVEEIIPIEDDFLLEVKILPDRPDCKTEKGLACEIASIFNLSLIPELDVCAHKNNAKKTISFKAHDINSILGLNLGDEEVIVSLRRFRIGIDKKGKELIAFIPQERSDLNIIEDLADEVGRLYGMDKIPSTPLPKNETSDNEKIDLNPTYDLSNKLREILLNAGYNEIHGYSLVENGELKIEKPLASDKAFLRTNLSTGLKNNLKLNIQNIFFDKDTVKLFEIGTVFTEEKETINLCVGIAFKSAKFKKSGLPDEVKKWGGKIISDDTTEILEIALDDLLTKINWKEPVNLDEFINLDVKFKNFSLYPRIFRDIALWADSSVKSEEVIQVITENAGEYLTEGPVLFDEFKKGNKTSFAFRMAFQASDKTLTDEEVNKIILNVQKSIKDKGWEVR